MKEITLDNGKKVLISDDSYKALAEAAKPEFKVGDWIVFDGTHHKSKALKLISKGVRSGWFTNHKNTLCDTNCKHYRYATDDEISKELGREGFSVGDIVVVNDTSNSAFVSKYHGMMCRIESLTNADNNPDVFTLTMKNDKSRSVLYVRPKNLVRVRESLDQLNFSIHDFCNYFNQ